MELPHLSRRSFLGGSVSLVMLSACGGSSTGSATPDGDGDYTLLAPFPDGLSFAPLFEAGTRQRAVYAFHDGEGYVTAGNPETMTIEVSIGDDVLETVDLPLRRSGIPTPYYAYWFTPEIPGIYDVKIPGTDVVTSFRVVERGQSGIPQVGDSIPAVPTATTADPAGVEPLCTRVPEPCTLHEVSWDAALDASGAKVLCISTPAFCQTAICGPVLELILNTAGDYPGVTFVHAEVYTDPFNDDPTLSRQPTAPLGAYNLAFEPILFVVDDANTITARLDTTWDETDLRMVLDEVASA